MLGHFHKMTPFYSGHIYPLPPKLMLYFRPMTGADPDLQVGGGAGHPDPELEGGGSQKNFFSAPRASIWSKNKGGPGSPMPLP